MALEKIKELEMKIYEMTKELNQLRKDEPGQEVQNYNFKTLNGPTTLTDLFANHSQLLLIHNMGKGCRYCTLWADGLNPFVEHLETAMSVVLVSKDSPEEQRKMANDRAWRFRTASHQGESYLEEQSVGDGNYPGAVLYEKTADGKIIRKNEVTFGPYDQFCSIWNFLSLAGLNEDNWTPQFSYFKRPEQMDDGGKNLN